MRFFEEVLYFKFILVVGYIGIWTPGLLIIVAGFYLVSTRVATPLIAVAPTVFVLVDLLLSIWMLTADPCLDNCLLSINYSSNKTAVACFALYFCVSG